MFSENSERDDSNVENHANLNEREAGMNTLSVASLGEFKINAAAGCVDHWHSRRAKLLFAYLILNRKAPVTNEEVMEILWPGRPQAPSSGNLKTAVYHLREILKPIFGAKSIDPIISRDGRYLINPDIELCIDFVEFEHHWQQGRKYDREGKRGLAKAEYEIAENLYHGDLLAEELYLEWLIPYREALKDKYILLLEKLCTNSFELGDYEACIEYCQKILAKDACLEDAYRKLMLCYHQMGQNAAALHWYEKCRINIKFGLNVQLSKETEELHSSLRFRGTVPPHEHVTMRKGADNPKREADGLTVHNITQRSANFQWTPQPEAGGYYVFVSKTQQIVFQTARTDADLNLVHSAAASFAWIDGLMPRTEYFVSVWANDPVTSFMGSASFTTPEDTSAGWSELALPQLETNEHITWAYRLNGVKLHDTISTATYITTSRKNLPDRIWLFDGRQWSAVYTGAVDRLSNAGGTLFGYKTGTRDGLIISLDGGLTWPIKYPAPHGVTRIQKWGIRMLDPNTIFWADFDVVYRSSDRGQTWIKTPLPIGIITLKRAPNGNLTACGIDSEGVLRGAQLASGAVAWEVTDLPVPLASKALTGTPNQVLGYNGNSVNGMVVTATTAGDDAGWWRWDFNTPASDWQRIDNGNRVNQGIALTNNTGAIGNKDEGNGVSYCLDEDSIVRLRGNQKQTDRISLPSGFGKVRFMDMTSTFNDPGAPDSAPNNIIVLVCTDGDNQAERVLIYRDTLNSAVAGLTVSNLRPTGTDVYWMPMDAASKYFIVVNRTRQTCFYTARSEQGLLVCHRANETTASVSGLSPGITYHASVWAAGQATSFMGSLTFTTPILHSP